MDTRKTAAEYRLSQWTQVIQIRKSTGQSVKDFCTSEGISKSTYLYWQRKLREAACTEFSMQEAISSSSLIPKGWAGIETKKSTCAEAELTIDIKGCRIIVKDDTDLDQLAKVCRLLKAL